MKISKLFEKRGLLGCVYLQNWLRLQENGGAGSKNIINKNRRKTINNKKKSKKGRQFECVSVGRSYVS